MSNVCQSGCWCERSGGGGGGFAGKWQSRLAFDWRRLSSLMLRPATTRNGRTLTSCDTRVMLHTESGPTPTKKRKRSRNKKKLLTGVDEKSSTKAENALYYLRNWNKRQESEWKFKKAQQVYLLKHGLTMSMSEQDFSVFCEYMKGLADRAKSALIAAAQRIVDDEMSADLHQERARLLIQCLHLHTRGTDNHTSTQTSEQSDHD